MKPIALFCPYHDKNIELIAIDVLRSGQVAGGPYVHQFSKAFGELIGNHNVVTTNDMSSAIQIALHIAGVRSGDEVLTAAFSCMSTNAPIATSGATPVWVDINPKTGTIDPEDFARSITPRTKAAIVYHLAGYPADVRQIAQLCSEAGIVLIEDCDNALLATVDGKLVGSFADFAIYSFYPNRHINATEGGALVCRNSEDAERAIKLRRYGIDLPRFRDANGEISLSCDISEIGWAATLNNLCSAIGLAQLPTVAGRIDRTRAVAKEMSLRLAEIPHLDIVEPLYKTVPTYWGLLVRVGRRDEVLVALKARNIHVSKLHQRTDIYSGFNAPRRVLPGTESFLETILALPCGYWMDENDIDYVVTSIRDVVGSMNIPSIKNSA